MVRTHLDSVSCPACHHQGLDYNAENVDLPYLGESLETMLRCNACGYRHTDFVLTEVKDPMRHAFTVRTEADIDVRVVRSSSGTVRIPELGVTIEPGIASDAFITNVEGILVRVEGVLDQLHRDAEDDEQKQRIEALQATFQAIREGRADPVTLILEDPFGNSAILHDAAVKEPIPAEEAARLKTGTFVMDPDGNVKQEEEGGDEPAAA